MERRGDSIWKYDAGPYPSTCFNPPEDKRVAIYGLSERKKCDDDIRAAWKFEIQVWK